MSAPVSRGPENHADAHKILNGFAVLGTLASMYPPGHPLVAAKLKEIDAAVQNDLKNSDAVRIDVIHGVVHINGVPLDEPYVQYRRPWDRPEVTLGAHEYFVVGDNRGMSQGAHRFGVVDEERILGSLVF